MHQHDGASVKGRIDWKCQTRNDGLNDGAKLALGTTMDFWNESRTGYLRLRKNLSSGVSQMYSKPASINS
jgi:hypothetical protein